MNNGITSGNDQIFFSLQITPGSKITPRTHWIFAIQLVPQTYLENRFLESHKIYYKFQSEKIQRFTNVFAINIIKIQFVDMQKISYLQETFSSPLLKMLNIEFLNNCCMLVINSKLLFRKSIVRNLYVLFARQKAMIDNSSFWSSILKK